MNIYLIFQKTKAPWYSVALVIRSWKIALWATWVALCQMLHAPLSKCEILYWPLLKTRTAKLRFNIADEIGWEERAALYSLWPSWEPASCKLVGRVARYQWADWSTDCGVQLQRTACGGALFLISSQSLCFSQNYWCMNGLEKQRGGDFKSAFELWAFLCFFSNHI